MNKRQFLQRPQPRKTAARTERSDGPPHPSDRFFCITIMPTSSANDLHDAGTAPCMRRKMRQLNFVLCGVARCVVSFFLQLFGGCEISSVFFCKGSCATLESKQLLSTRFEHVCNARNRVRRPALGVARSATPRKPCHFKIRAFRLFRSNKAGTVLFCDLST